MIGQNIAHYRVTAKLGAGGMGEVYRATDTKLGRDVALKVLPPESARDAAARARLIAEARKASALNHPHICHIYEVNESEGVAYFAMELAEGEPLSRRIPPEGMPAETVIRFGEQIAAALAHAHERGILHRDLKSSNVMITPQGAAKVLDFGLAQRLGGEKLAEATRSAMSLEPTSTMAGTLPYLSPEVLSGQAASERSDIWSLGVLLYEMASGAYPFSGRTGYEITSAILRETPPPLAQTPPALRAVIQRCLAKEPGQRYQAAGEVRAALEAIGSSVLLPAPPAPRQNLRWIWLALGTFALVAVVLAILKPWKATPPPAGAGGTAPGAAPPSSVLAMPRIERPSPIPEANEVLGRALLFMRVQSDVLRGRQLLERALELDPKFADARAFYAMSHIVGIEVGISNNRDDVYRAEEQARLALSVAPDLARGHCALGAALFFEGRGDLANAEIERCRQINPKEMGAYVWASHNARISGDAEESMRVVHAMIEAEPLFWAARGFQADLLREAGKPQEAARVIEPILDQDPQNVIVVRGLARAHLEQGDLQGARRILARLPPEFQGNFRLRMTRAQLDALEGKRAEALKELDEQELKYAELSPFMTLEAAEVYALIGEKDKAIEWVDRSVRKGDERADWMLRDPLLANIREEPRFKQILNSIESRHSQRRPTPAQP